MKTKFVCLAFLIFGLILHTSIVKADSIPIVNQTLVQNKVEALKLHRVPYGNPLPINFNYQIIPLTDSLYQLLKPATAMLFDAGYVTNIGNFYYIYVSKPTTPQQIAAFANDDKVVLYYLSQAYFSFFYQTTQMPIWFKVGTAAYEARLDISDSTIKVALNNYGDSISDFAILNDTTNFRINNGLAVSYMFGEYMSVFKLWGYDNIYQLTSQSISVVPWWFGVNNMTWFLHHFNRYLYLRINEPDENLRVKLNLESAHFLCYFRNADNFCFPDFINTLENAYTEYCNILNVQATEKLTFFTFPECLGAAIFDTVPCLNRLTGGTAWSSGISTTCANNVGEIPLFLPLLRHELAHGFQGLIKQGYATAWFNEGWACFFDQGPITPAKLTQLRPDAILRMNNAITYFGHRPTYTEIGIYPSPDYGYYTLGTFFLDYIYRKGGYQAVKNVSQNDFSGYQQLGYSSGDAFLKAFYFDFDTRVRNLNVVTLVKPDIDSTLNTSDVQLLWEPLDSNIVLNVDVSLGNDSTWVNIVSNTTQKSFLWNTGGFFGKFWLRFLAPNDLNINTVFGPFENTNPQILTLYKPNENNIVVGGDTVLIKWANCNIPLINIQYTLNNGLNWLPISSNVPIGALIYKWVLPDTASNFCKVRIVDVTNNLIYDESDTVFRIVKEDPVGGPYRLDTNTIVLLHFNENLNNESSLTEDALGVQADITYTNSFDTNLGTSLSSLSALTIAHNSILNLEGDWTIEMWVKLTAFATNGYSYFITKPGSPDPYLATYSLHTNQYWGNVFYGFFFDDASVRIGITETAPQLNVWYHVALVKDNQNHTLRIIVHDSNRNQLSNYTQPFTNTGMLLNTNAVRICDGVQGYIDELRISNVVRTLQGITTALPDNNPNTLNDVVSVYPNPATSMLNVEIHNNKSELTVSDILGNVKIKQQINNYAVAIDISGLKSGIYFVKLECDKGAIVKKFVKE